MKNVDLYGRVRHAVLIDGMSSREAGKRPVNQRFPINLLTNSRA